MGNLTMRNPALLSESKALPVLLTYQRCVLTLETEHTSPSVSLKSKWHKHEAWKMHPSVRLLVLTALVKWSSQEDRCRAARLILFTVGRQSRARTDSRATLPTHAVPRKGRTCHYRWVTQENNHLTPCRVFTVASEPLATQTKSICSSGSDRVGGMASRGGLHPGLAAKPAVVLRGEALDLQGASFTASCHKTREGALGPLWHSAGIHWQDLSESTQTHYGLAQLETLLKFGQM